MEAAEIAGTVVFAISGVVAVADRPLDWFGAVVVGVVTALGGGTIRGVLLGVTPVFWVEDQTFLLAAIVGSVAAIALVRASGRAPLGRAEAIVELADAAGLALFTVVGADLALDLGFDGWIAVVAGVVTGVGGGVIRDLLAGRTPLIMRGEIYATAALAGVALFVGLDELGVHEAVAAVLGGLGVLGLRLLGIRRALSLPTLQAEGRGAGAG